MRKKIAFDKAKIDFKSNHVKWNQIITKFSFYLFSFILNTSNGRCVMQAVITSFGACRHNNIHFHDGKQKLKVLSSLCDSTSNCKFWISLFMSLISWLNVRVKWNKTITKAQSNRVITAWAFSTRREMLLFTIDIVMRCTAYINWRSGRLNTDSFSPTVT